MPWSCVSMQVWASLQCSVGVCLPSSMHMRGCTKAKPCAHQMICCAACAGVSLVSLAQPVVQQLLARINTTQLHQQLRLRLPPMTRGTASAAASSHLLLARSSCNGLLQWLRDRVCDPLW